MPLLSNLPPGSPPSANVVTRKVFINGTELGAEVLLLQVLVTKAFNRIAAAKLVFVDGSVATRNFQLSSDDRFKPGAEIKIQLGFGGIADTVFEGIIIKHNIKIKPGGSSCLLIEAKDKAVKLAGARKFKYFIDKKDSDVFAEIAESAGLTCEAEATLQVNKQLVQYDATNWDFLVTRAEANGMLVLTDDSKIIIKKPDALQAPLAGVVFGSNLFDFEAEMDARRQFQNVKAKSWDFSTQEIVTSENGDASFDENGNIASQDLGAVLGMEQELTHIGKMETAQLQDWADAYALKNKVAKTAGKLKILGNAAIKPGTVVSLDGVGDRFNGNVLVTGVKHSYDGNWTTDLQFGWAEESFYKKPDVMDKPAGGLLPGISGLQVGVVMDLDDPEGQFRIKVTIPTIAVGEDGIWARVATLDAGDNRGTYFRPKEGDEVVLGFLHDDPQYPVVLGCFHSNDSKKAPLPESEGNEEFGFVSGAGSKLVFNDTDSKIVISVAANDGEKTLILNDAGKITLKDALGNKLVMDSTGITIEASANIVIKGSLVQIN